MNVREPDLSFVIRGWNENRWSDLLASLIATDPAPHRHRARPRPTRTRRGWRNLKGPTDACLLVQNGVVDASRPRQAGHTGSMTHHTRPDSPIHVHLVQTL